MFCNNKGSLDYEGKAKKKEKKKDNFIYSAQRKYAQLWTKAHIYFLP